MQKFQVPSRYVGFKCHGMDGIDVLVMERFVLMKDRQPNAEEHEIDEYLAQFQLD